MAKFEHLEKRFYGIAKKLTNDSFLRYDLIQEMRIKVWQCGDGHTDSYYLELGKNAALRYMQRHADVIHFPQIKSNYTFGKSR